MEVAILAQMLLVLSVLPCAFSQHASMCGNLTAPQYGDVILSNGTFLGSEATYSCTEGFGLIGRETRVCQENGVWSGDLPSCKEILRIGLTSENYTTVEGRRAAFCVQVESEALVSHRRVCVHARTRSGTGNLDNYCYRTSPDGGESDAISVIRDLQFGGQEPSLQCVGIRTCGDSKYENTEEIYVDIYVTLHAQPVELTITTATVFITNDDFPTYGFSQTSYTVRETETEVRVCIKSPCCDSTVCCLGPCGCKNAYVEDILPVVTLSTRDGSASAPNDYLSKTVDLTFQRSLMYLTTLCEHITIVNDNIPERQENFSLVLSSSNPDVRLGYGESGNQWNSNYIPNVTFIVINNDDYVDCGQLSDPANGSVNAPYTGFDEQATYSCNVGYELKGPMTHVCQANGEWSGNETTCEAVDCGTLSSPGNGSVDVSGGTTFGSSAVYNCVDGYNLVGQNVRRCQSNATWSFSEPQCIVIDCGTPPNPANGSAILTQSTFTSKAVYTCSEGFHLSGNNTVRLCQADGEWSGITPTCEAVNCGILESPSNGQVSFNGTTFLFEALYVCDEGYEESTGNDMLRRCQSNGTWSGNKPVCTAVDCGSALAPLNGAINLTATILLSRAYYNCSQGYILKGASSRTCMPDGNWSGEEPTCEIIDCGPARTPENGDATFNGTKFLSEVSYTCNEGYALVGNITHSCEESGEWSGGRVLCVSQGNSSSESRIITVTLVPLLIILLVATLSILVFVIGCTIVIQRKKHYSRVRMNSTENTYKMNIMKTDT